MDGFGGAVGAAGGALEEVGQLALAVVDAAEVDAVAEGPVHGADVHLRRSLRSRR
jgi:hypothetical protein